MSAQAQNREDLLSALKRLRRAETQPHGGEERGSGVSLVLALERRFS